MKDELKRSKYVFFSFYICYTTSECLKQKKQKKLNFKQYFL